MPPSKNRKVSTVGLVSASGMGGFSFRVGDRVVWESQSRGVWTVKEGVVVALVLPEVSAYRVIMESAALSDRRRYDYRELGGGCARPSASVLVAVTTVTGKGKIRRRQRLYWPRMARVCLSLPSERGGRVGAEETQHASPA